MLLLGFLGGTQANPQPQPDLAELDNQEVKLCAEGKKRGETRLHRV